MPVLSPPGLPRLDADDRFVVHGDHLVVPLRHRREPRLLLRVRARRTQILASTRPRSSLGVRRARLRGLFHSRAARSPKLTRPYFFSSGRNCASTRCDTYSAARDRGALGLGRVALPALSRTARISLRRRGILGVQRRVLTADAALWLNKRRLSSGPGGVTSFL